MDFDLVIACITAVVLVMVIIYLIRVHLHEKRSLARHKALVAYQAAIDAGEVRPLTTEERECIRKNGIFGFIDQKCDKAEAE
jgi:hypothetical protein